MIRQKCNVNPAFFRTHNPLVVPLCSIRPSSHVDYNGIVVILSCHWGYSKQIQLYFPCCSHPRATTDNTVDNDIVRHTEQVQENYIAETNFIIHSSSRPCSLVHQTVILEKSVSIRQDKRRMAKNQDKHCKSLHNQAVFLCGINTAIDSKGKACQVVLTESKKQHTTIMIAINSINSSCGE